MARVNDLRSGYVRKVQGYSGAIKGHCDQRLGCDDGLVEPNRMITRSTDTKSPRLTP